MAANYNSTTGIADGVIAEKRFVMINPAVADGVTLTTGATVEVLGVTRGASTAAGQAIEVQVEGEAKVTVASASSARGDYVTVDNAGKAVVTTTAGTKIQGIVLKGTANAGETATILLKRFTIAV
jgi:hypothetical protein